MQRSLIAIGSAAMLLAAASANAQQPSSTAPLAFVDPNSIPSGYAIVSVDGAGVAVVETTHDTILQATPYPYSYNLGAISSTAPKPAFNITGDGRMEWKKGPTNPVIQGSRHVAGKTDLEAGLIALNDGSNGGCAYVMCSWYGADATTYAGPCAKPLDNLARIVRNQGWQAVPSCHGTSLVYAPVTCASPWQLVNKGDWQSYACRAMVRLAPPPPPQPEPGDQVSAAILQDLINNSAPCSRYPNGDGSWSVVCSYTGPGLPALEVNVQVARDGNAVCWSPYTGYGAESFRACNGSEFTWAYQRLWYLVIFTQATVGFDGGGGGGGGGGSQ